MRTVRQLRFERFNVVTSDTDVVVLADYFQSKLAGKISMQFGTAPNLAYYDISLHTYLMLNWFRLYLKYMLSVVVILPAAL